MTLCSPDHRKVGILFLEELGLELDLSNIRPEFTINFDHGFDDYFIIQKDVDIRKLKLQKEEVAAVKWATKYEVHNLAAKHQMIPYILFDFRRRFHIQVRHPTLQHY